MPVLRRYLLTGPLLAMLVGCATNPVTGQSQFVLLSETQELSLGRQNDPKIRQQYGVYDDPELQAYVQQLGQKLAAKSHRSDLVYRFTVLDSDAVNAFALPGGYIYITRGILAYINSEAELAAVLGHEIGHVTARHSVRQYTGAMATGIGASILSAVIPELGNQVGQELMNVIGNALLSGYGREHELEADRLGAEYLARNGYDPDAMIGVVGILKNQEEFEKKRAKEEGREARIYHGVFASHPSADKRLQQVVGEAKKFKTGAATRVARSDYLKRLNNTVFGDSAAQGVRVRNMFYHRDLNIALRFPEGWHLENSPKAITANNPDRSAVIQVLAQDLNKRATPREFMDTQLKLSSLKQEGEVAGQSYPSYTAVSHIGTPFGRRDTRVSVVFYNSKAFVIYGTTKSEQDFSSMDPAFVATAHDLRPLRPEEKPLAEGLRLRIVEAKTGDTFAKLAQKSPISPYAESMLRLINDKFPKGEPKPGESIKIVE
jgi:predicted Zn-dependent protease